MLKNLAWRVAMAVFIVILEVLVLAVNAVLNVYDHPTGGYYGGR